MANAVQRLPHVDCERLGVSWRAKDIAGKRYGRLVAIRPVGRNQNRSVLWQCRCDCGSATVASVDSLQRASTSSCGCIRSHAARRRIVRAGGPWNRGKSYQIRTHEEEYRSLAAWRIAACKHHGAACQSCGWNKASCDVHHKVPRSSGGLNTIANAVVLCPNCHRVAHGAVA